MKRYRWIRWTAIISLVILPLLLTGCGLFKSDDASSSIDPPQNEELSAQTEAEAVMGSGEEAEQTRSTLYFKDANGFVAPLSMNVPKVMGIAQKSLEYMVEGGPAADMLPAGFTALIPQGTKIKGMNIIEDKKLAIVDFSKEFTSYNVRDERKILEAITWTLTGFPTIDQVEIWVEGEALEEMPVDGTPLDEPLSRVMGINIEMSDGVNLSQSSPVTLYFLNQSEDEFQYYVPVTRMVERTDDIASAALAELIKGPKHNSSLEQVIVPTAELLDVTRNEDIITVNFTSAILSADEKAPAESLQSVILSLTDTTGASKVQIMVDGKAKISSTDEQSYSTPVSRPTVVNPFKL
jgi:germination protein M